jgi:phenol 2-monooxygenase
VGTDLFKVFVDCESYNSGHGYSYQKYAIDETKGALVVVRPDHCTLHTTTQESLSVWLTFLDISLITDLEDYEGLGDFFKGFSM